MDVFSWVFELIEGWLYGKGPLLTDGCAGCGNTDLTEIAPDAYRCDCGYEGGEGYAGYQREARREGYAKESITALHSHLERHVTEALTRVASVSGVPDLSDPIEYGGLSFVFSIIYDCDCDDEFVCHHFDDDDDDDDDRETFLDEQDRLEMEQRATERDVAGTFVHEKVREITLIIEVMIEKGEAYLALVLIAARRSGPKLSQGAAAIKEIAMLLTNARQT